MILKVSKTNDTNTATITCSHNKVIWKVSSQLFDDLFWQNNCFSLKINVTPSHDLLQTSPKPKHFQFTITLRNKSSHFSL